MPTISLRLTEAEHEELKAWAHDGRRSVQKEIIWRLFTIEGNEAAKTTRASSEPRKKIGDIPSDGSLSARVSDEYPHFKPDFK